MNASRSPTAPTASTLVELLRTRAILQPDARAFTFLLDGDTEEVTLTYAALDRQARAIGARLLQGGHAGRRALLLYAPGPEYVAAFFGCLYAGVTAVPAYPPMRPRQAPRLQAIAADAEAELALTTSPILEMLQAFFTDMPDLAALTWLTTDGEDDAGHAAAWRVPELTSSTLAFLQYTSGSTSTPKGVVLTHGNLLHNLSLIQRCFGHTPESRGVIWLPPYHDMGLIGGILQPIFVGFPVTLMSPLAFLQRPMRWLEAVSRERATTSGGPNFAYDLCARRATAEELAKLDLSAWNVAFTGAEPVRAETLERFTEVFAPCGFRRSAFYPCYGLAEATLIVSGGEHTAAPVVRHARADALERNRFLEAPAGTEGSRPFIGCGQSLPDQRILIVDPQTAVEVAPGHVGEIWVSGPSVAQGYWRRPEQTAQTFHARLAGGSEGPFLRTGDLGFLDGGELFVTGRLKDLIILRGRNHYPQDIELTAEQSHPALRSGCGAAFSVDAGGEEQLVVVYEVDRHHLKIDPEPVAAALRRAVAEQHGVSVSEVVLIRTGGIPKTSSGKIQRNACREAFRTGALDIIGRSGPAPSEPGTPAPALDRERLLATAPEDRQGLLEQDLRERVARLLQVPPAQVPAGQPVSALGLDSLMAVELQHGIETGFHVPLPMADVLEGASLGDLAASVLRSLEARMDAPGVDAVESSAGVGSDRLPLSPGQQALWFLQQLDARSVAYNIASAVRIRGPLDMAALRSSLRALVERHEQLRSTFTDRDGGVRQVIAPFHDGCFLLEEEAGPSEAWLRERLAAEAHRPFDLERGPLLRVHLFERSAQEHVLLLAVHHLVADLWSLTVMIRELDQLYPAALTGVPANLPPLPLRYTDHVRRQLARLERGEGERLWASWRERLAGPLPVLDLATDHPRPPVQTYRGGSVPFRVGDAVSRKLKALARSTETTLFTTLLAAFQVLLHRHSGQEDILVGSPTLGRTDTGTAHLVGYFVNPVVLRADLSGQPDFESFLRRMRHVVLEALKHQDFPFALLVDRLQPQRDASRSPLFQAMFALQQAQLPAALRGLPEFALGAEGATMTVGGLPFEAIALEQQVSQFDLTLMMAEHDAGLSGAFQYNSDLFEAATVERMVSRFLTLLEGIVADPRQPVSALPLLPEAERQRLLVDLNATAAPYPLDSSLPALFFAQAARSPDASALFTSESQLSFRSLSERVARLSHHLRHLGVGPEVTVGVFLPRSDDLVTTLLAILCAGGTYVPLDPAYPPERLALMLEDSRASLVLTHSALAPRLPSGSHRALCLDTVAEDVASRPSSPPPLSLFPDNLAYLIYTSGSTGRPKAVAISHRSALAMLFWARDCFSPEERSGVFACTSICFDLSVFELFLPLCFGGCVVLADNALHLPSHPAASHVSLLNTVPSALSELLRGAGLPPSVRTVNLAGEPLPRALVTRAYQVPSVQRLFNLYGPSEDTTYSTWALIDSSEAGTPPIGRAISNSQVYLLDRFGQPTPFGVPGEVFLGGEGLARGYLGQPALTAERFVPNPFSSTPGARLYRTGDLARWRPDGQLEFLGRNDHQVKLRGFRIELGEIEAALARQPGVREVAVLVREDVPGDKRLVAYLVLAPDAPSVSDLRRALQQQLPGYMVPAHLLPLDALPLTPNGKLDRRALPAPDARPSLDTGFVAPRSALEQQLASAWQSVLRLDKVGVHDSFFDLGGNSLLATQVVSRLRDRSGLTLPLHAFFQAPTVSGLARHLQTHAAAPVAFQPRPNGPLPLSFAQERLWFIDQLLPGSPLYIMPLAVRLTGALDVAALAQSLRALVQRHESLRTTFGLVDDKPVQVIAPSVDVPLPLTDLRSLPPEARSAAVAQHTQDFALQPFDLRKGPLLRSCLLRLADDSHVWLLSLHHIVADGWSLGVLVQEVAALYASALRGEPDALPPLPIQYADYALWQREWLQGPARQPLLDYWTRKLADTPTVLELPTDFPRPAIASSRGALQPLHLPTELTAALRALSREEGVTLFMTLMAAFQVLLQRYCAKDDFVVGTPIANRTLGQTEALIGCFVNTLPIRANLAGQPSFRALLRRVQATCLEAYAHQELPFEHLVDALQLSRDLSHTPLVQVLFVLQNAPMATPALPGLHLEALPTQSSTAKFDLTLSLEETSGGLKGWIEYRTELFKAETIERLAGHLRTLLEGIVTTPSESLTTLPVLPEAERRQVLVDFNANTTAYPSDSIASLFHAQAARTPDAPALLTSDSTLSYRALSERVARLAHYLRHLGVGPEVTVAVFLERSPDLVVSLLAILSAGGAYVPLDTTYPAERLAFMLGDSGASIVVTHSALASLVPPGAHRVLCLDEVQAEVASQPSSPPPCALSPLSLAYLIYTSGSTGRPKGVSVPHQAVLRLVKHSNFFSLSPDDVVLHLAPVAFDASTFEIWAPLLNGARLALFPSSPPSADSLAHAVASFRVSTLWLTAGLFHQLVDSLDDSLLPLLQSLRTLLAGGDVLSPSHVRAWLTRLPHSTLVNGYGPTENTTFTCCAPLFDSSQVGASVPLGRPISNTSVFVLDRFGQPCPIGVPGELFTGGDGLARGYLGQPSLTAERFVPNPFSTTPGARLYRTGDLARWRHDGQLEFLGRRDNQVKLRGFRIELGEIEAALARQPGVREVAVLVREDVPGDKRLVAYLVLSPDAPSVSELRRVLQQQLPGYMVPAHLLPLDAFPLTPNGKLDRRALPAPDARPSLDTGFIAPQSALELQLASAWQSVLRLDKVGVHDNFFDLGGNSLLMVQLHTRLRESLKLDVPLVELFQAPTIRSLAKHVTQQSETGSFEHSQDRATNRKASMKNQRALRERNKTTKK